MKKHRLKKNSFIKGTMIATLCIVITKFLGVLYVIPFHSLIGDEGGALYGYAYTIYMFFMSLATAGIPLAISKLVSEYQTLGYNNVKRRAFLLGKRIALMLGLISFTIIMIFAKYLAYAILGGINSTNSVNDVTFVIRVIGTAILIIPVLSVYRGYFEGHRFIESPSFSQVIEQFFRVMIIIFGSLISIRVLHLDLKTTVGISLFGATVGGIIAYLYLLYKHSSNKSKFNERIRNVNEPFISDKVIIKKIIVYSVPFIMIDIFKSLYNYVDMFTVVKSLVNYANYSGSDAETIYSMLSTWGSKFNMIVLAISSALVVNLIPNLTNSLTKKDYKNAEKKVIQGLNILLFIAIPITFGISFIAKPVWILFYGNSVYGPSVLGYYIFVGLFIALATIIVTSLQAYREYKWMFISLFVGIVIKLCLNVNLVVGFTKMGLPPYYGFITATLLGYFITFIISLLVFVFKYKFDLENTIKNFIDIICGSILMLLVLFLISYIIPIYSNSRWINLFIVIIYGLIGAIIYFCYTYKCGLINKIFGNKINNLIRFKVK